MIHMKGLQKGQQGNNLLHKVPLGIVVLCLEVNVVNTTGNFAHVAENELFVPRMAVRSGPLIHCHCWAAKNTCRADSDTKIKNKRVNFVLQDTFSPLMHCFPLYISPLRNSLQFKCVEHYPESECNPLKALKKAFRRTRVTKGGVFKLVVGFMSQDLSVKKLNVKIFLWCTPNCQQLSTVNCQQWTRLIQTLVVHEI